MFCTLHNVQYLSNIKGKSNMFANEKPLELDDICSVLTSDR